MPVITFVLSTSGSAVIIVPGSSGSVSYTHLVSAILMSAVVKHSQGYFRTQQKYLGNINGQIEETFAGHLVIKAFNKEEETIAAFDETNKAVSYTHLDVYKRQLFQISVHLLHSFFAHIAENRIGKSFHNIVDFSVNRKSCLRQRYEGVSSVLFIYSSFYKAFLFQGCLLYTSYLFISNAKIHILYRTIGE